MTYLDRVSQESRLSINKAITIAKELVPAEFRSNPWMHAGKHGTKLLETEEEMNCYMAAYGEMHMLKIKEVLKHFPFDALQASFEIVDWGCGQGIATMTFLDALSERGLLDRIRSIILIEPSHKTLARAEANIRNFLYGRAINTITIPKYLPSESSSANAVNESELSFKTPATVHLFSNILDISSISLKKTAELVLSSGIKHYILCAGPINGTSSRIDEFCSLFNGCSFFSITECSNYAKVNNGYHFSCKTRGLVIDRSSGINNHIKIKSYRSDGYYDDYDQRAALYGLSDEEKIAVIIVGYQLLVSSKCCPLDERDNPSIDIILRYCGFDGSEFAKKLGELFWNKAIVNNPYPAFAMIAGFSQEKKAAVRCMLKELVAKDNHLLRENIAKQLEYLLGL